MAIRPQKDSESPSASTFLLPQFRHSRRGSIASLASRASVNQIDKETLSQTLDQIHTSASQTDKLTTFNEFTAPPSSVLDSKGIASELQGGISGLYNRFRASVGNAIDVSGAGEDDTADRLSGRSVAKPSPAPSIKSSPKPTQAVDQNQVPWSDHARTEADHQSPLLINSVKAPKIEPEKHDGQGVSKVNVVPEMPSGKLNQTVRMEDGNPVSVESKSNINTKRLGNTSSESVSVASAIVPNPISHRNELSHSSDTPSETLSVSKKGDISSNDPPLVHLIGHNQRAAHMLAHRDGPSEGTGTEEHPSSRRTHPSGPTPQPSKTQLHSKASSNSGDEANNPMKPQLGAINNDLDAASSRSAIDLDQASASPNVSDKTTTNQFRGRKSTPQHVELAARKTMAPPLISHAESPPPMQSRASSTDTNTDSLHSTPHQFPLRQANEGSKGSKDAHPIAQARALQRDPRMMNVFSQSKNKVLNKEYWMKDENARDCFNCGEAFSTFRRKHHCRMFPPSVFSNVC